MTKHLVAVGLLAALAGPALAQFPPPQAPLGPPYAPFPRGVCPMPVPPPQAPDACGPGWYGSNCWGMVYGPNYDLRPPCLPWNGALPRPQNGAGAGGQFPTHPFARSPRDFFMEYEKEQDVSPYSRGIR